MQKLTLPMNDLQITASIDTESYKKFFGFRHYGTDLISVSRNRMVYASGDGTVVDCGVDRACGNILVVRYNGAYNHKKKRVVDVVFRYMHLGEIEVIKGSVVNSGTLLGEYGETGAFAGTGKHLHLEVDSDVVNILHTPTVAKSDYLKGQSQGAHRFDSADNTVGNVMEFLHINSGSQSYHASTSDPYVRKEDRVIPVSTIESLSVESLRKENKQLKSKLEEIRQLLG